MIYAIGDVHGQFEMLQDVHASIEADAAREKIQDYHIVHVGDLTDRGPRSAEVVEYLASAIAKGAPYTVLKGNHDRMFTTFMDDPHGRDPILRREYTWLSGVLGGVETRTSYGVDVQAAADVDAIHREALLKVPDEHLAFLKGLPSSYQTEHFFMVHAGIRPGVPLDDQVEDDLIWIRAEFLQSLKQHPKVVIHGHTPEDEVVHYGNRIGIDTGAAYGGPLSVVVCDGPNVWQLTADGRQAVPRI